jgi:rod shape determining protein RodA
MVAIIEKRDLRDFDWLTTMLAIAIACFGVWQIHNAVPTESYWSKQIVGLCIALVAFAVVAFSDYKRIIDFAPIFYVGGLFLLLLVITPLGVEVNGQKAWLKLPVIGQFQPSEFMKIPTVLMLAKYFGNKRVTGPLGLREALIGGAILGGPLLLIMLEPDAGQAITYIPIIAAVFFLSAIKIRYVVIAVVAAAIFVPSAYMIGVKTGKIKRYQQERILAIIDPDSVDPKGYGYHTIQSTITVGKGGLTGIKGDTETSQSVLKFLPEPHTDFIFAVTAENTGFIGCVSLLLAYALLLSRMIAGARQASDRAGMLVIMSIATALSFQIFINIGMALGFLPVIGVPLPLMSAGLSAILSTFIAIGFVVSITMRRFVN